MKFADLNRILTVAVEVNRSVEFNRFNRYSTWAVFLEITGYDPVVVNFNKLKTVLYVWDVERPPKSLQPRVFRVMPKTLSYMSFPFLLPPNQK